MALCPAVMDAISSFSASVSTYDPSGNGPAKATVTLIELRRPLQIELRRPSATSDGFSALTSVCDWRRSPVRRGERGEPGETGEPSKSGHR